MALVVLIMIIVTAVGSSADAKYIDRLDEGGIAYSSEAAAIKTGESICDSLDAGYSVDSVSRILLGSGSGYGPFDVGYIVGASVYAYCPEYGDQIL